MVLSAFQIDMLLAMLDRALLEDDFVVCSNIGLVKTETLTDTHDDTVITTATATAVAVTDTGLQESRDATILRTFQFIMKDEVALLEKAAFIVDRQGDRDGRPIVCYEMHAQPGDPFRRRVWRVPGYDRESYLCYKNYCSCRSYFDKARVTRGRVMCKHLVAVMLASALKRVKVFVVSEAEVSSMLISSLGNKQQATEALD